MNCKIPFTKEIDFEKKVSEITSISLEHDFKVEGLTLNGNFIVSGDFKSHEVSVNKEAFSYVLPFEIDLAEDIDSETLEFMIDDFTYEIIDNTKLKVNIDFNVIASKKEAEEVKEEETLFQDPNTAFDVKNEERLEPEVIALEKEEEVISKESEDTIINSIKSDKDEYATYHIHMVSDGETIETVCTMYNSNINVLSEYNDLSSVSSGDKIIVPEINE